MNIQSTLAQLNQVVAKHFNTNGLDVDGLQWVQTDTVAGVDDSRYGKGLVIKFTTGKMAVFHNQLVMEPGLRTELGCGRLIPEMNQTIFAVILMELADIHKENWVEAKTINALKTALSIAVEDTDRMAMGKANWGLDSAIVGMRVREVQHKHFKDSMWTAGAYGLLTVALVTASILDARTEA
jgi:hypothetical protein